MLQNLSDFFYYIRWQDFLDIAFLSYIFYRLILLTQGTRTIQIIGGLTLIALTYYLATSFNLFGVSWLLNNLFNSIVLVVLVLFQSDFRNALAHMGTRTFFKRTKDASKNILQPVSDICIILSKSKIGALIVLEGKVGLAHLSRTGTQVDGIVSAPILSSIFENHSALHDGAVIIDRAARIVAAGCILPLTTRMDLVKKMGTRHRAALGLSEESDAVIVVVSEETGQISVAYQGELYPIKDLGTLQQNIANFLSFSNK